jgi:hypothetical protein
MLFQGLSCAGVARYRLHDLLITDTLEPAVLLLAQISLRELAFDVKGRHSVALGCRVSQTFPALRPIHAVMSTYWFTTWMRSV